MEEGVEDVFVCGFLERRVGVRGADERKEGKKERKKERKGGADDICVRLTFEGRMELLGAFPA